MNHSRSWAYDSGTLGAGGPGRDPAAGAAAAARRSRLGDQRLPGGIAGRVLQVASCGGVPLRRQQRGDLGRRRARRARGDQRSRLGGQVGHHRAARTAPASAGRGPPRRGSGPSPAWRAASGRRGRRSRRARRPSPRRARSAQTSATSASASVRGRDVRRRRRRRGRGRQRGPVQLAVRRSAAARRARRTRPAPGARQLARRRSAAARPRRPAPTHVADQASARRVGRGRPPPPRATPGLGAQRRLDLARLDPDAADLDLVVERGRGTPASRRPATGPGRRCGTSAARPARTGRAGTARRSAPGRPQVAAGEAGAADVQLAGHARRHRVAAPRRARRPGCSGGRRSAPARRAAPSPGRPGAATQPTVASVGPYSLITRRPRRAARQPASCSPVQRLAADDQVGRRAEQRLVERAAGRHGVTSQDGRPASPAGRPRLVDPASDAPCRPRSAAPSSSGHREVEARPASAAGRCRPGPVGVPGPGQVAATARCSTTTPLGPPVEPEV